MLKKKYFKILALMLFIGNNLYSAAPEEISQPEAPPITEEVIDFDTDEENDIVILPPEPVKVNNEDVKVGLTMEFPVIGNVTLYSDKDESGKEILKAVLSTSIDISEIDTKIDNFTVIIKDGKTPTVSADVSLFGKKGTLELVKIKKEGKIEKEPVSGTKVSKLKLPIDEAHFRVKFIDKPSLEILPSKELALNYLDLYIYKDKKPKLSATINILGNEVELAISYNNRVILDFLLKQITLGDLIPDIKGTDFDKIGLKDVTLKALLPSKKDNKGFQLDIEGSADFSSLSLGINIGKNNLTVKGSYGKDKGLSLEAVIDSLDILDVAKLKQATINFYSTKAIKPQIEEINKKISEEKDEQIKKVEQNKLVSLQAAEKENKPFIFIGGNGSLNLPGIGSFNLALNAGYFAKGLELKGSVLQPVSLSDFNINNAQVEFNQKSNSLSITGDAKILGLDLKAKLSAAPGSNNQKSYSMTASAGAKEWKIFSGIPGLKDIPEIKDLELKNVEVKTEISKADKGNLQAKLDLTGTASIFGTDMKADAKAIKADNQSGILLKAESADPKKLPGGLGDKLPIEKAYFILTNLNYKDPVYGDLKPGINVDLKVDTNKGDLANVTKFIDKFSGINLGTSIDLKGNLTENIGGSSLYVEVGKPFSFSLGNKELLESDPFKLQLTLLPLQTAGIGVSGLEFSVEAGMKLLLKNINSDLNNLDFKTKVGINTGGSATIEGSMEGKLDLKPIGLPIEFGNINLKAGVGLTTGLTEVGMAGEFAFGPKDKETKIDAAFDINTSGTSTNILAFGDLHAGKDKKNALNLEDIFNLAESAIGKLDINSFKANIPELGIKKAKFYFSPANVYFASKVWPAGFNLDIELDLFGKTASLEVNIDSSGFDATGFLSEVELGPVKITGAGKNKVCSKTDKCLESCNSKKEAVKEKSINIINPGTLKEPAKPKVNLEGNKISNNLQKAFNEKEDYSKEKGAIVNLAFRPASLDIGLFLSSDVAVDLGPLGKVETDTCMSISPKGVYFSFDHNLFDSFKTQFTINAKDFTKPTDWYICAKLEQDLLDKLSNEIKKFVESAKKEADEKLNEAKAGVATADKAVQGAQKDVDDAMKTAQEALDSAKNTELEKELEKAKKECGL